MQDWSFKSRETAALFLKTRRRKQRLVNAQAAHAMLQVCLLFLFLERSRQACMHSWYIADEVYRKSE